MRTLLISSSPRREKSQTFLLAKEVLAGCANDKDVRSETIHLCDLKIEFCHSCEDCHKKILSCRIKDDVQMILKKMLKADGIILASPNYINQVSASMKALFDRSSHFIHCRRLLGKYITGIVSSGSGHDIDVLDYIKYYANICGAQYSGGVSSRVPINNEKMEEAFKLGNKLILDIKEKRIFPEQIEVIEKLKHQFGKVMEAQKSEWIEEYRYWRDKGWLIDNYQKP